MSAIEVHNPEGGDLFRIADVFAKSGMFPEARDAAQCAAKLIVGQGLGLTPYDSMNGLHIIQGKAVLAANTMAAAIKRSGKYDYRAETDDEACTIAFYDLSQRDTDGRPATIGTTTFTMDDARRAGLGGQNWKKYPRAMLFARAISAGYREHCPDALGAAPVYVEATARPRSRESRLAARTNRRLCRHRRSTSSATCSTRRTTQTRSRRCSASVLASMISQNSRPTRWRRRSHG
jgi:hypothetical protein